MSNLLSELNSLDIILLIAVGFFLIKGLFRGLIHEVLSLAGLLLGFVLAVKFMGDFADKVSGLLQMSRTAALVLAFLLIFFGILMLVQYLIYTFKKLTNFVNLGWLDKLGGASFGFLKGATAISLLLLFITVIPYHETLLPNIKESKLYRPARRFAPRMFDYIMGLSPNSQKFLDEVRKSAGHQQRTAARKLLNVFEEEDKAAAKEQAKKAQAKENKDSY